MAKGKWGAVEDADDQHYWEGTVKSGYAPACGYVVSVPKLDFKSTAKKCVDCLTIASAPE